MTVAAESLDEYDKKLLVLQKSNPKEFVVAMNLMFEKNAASDDGFTDGMNDDEGDVCRDERKRV
jgi:hypothetical protein